MATAIANSLQDMGVTAWLDEREISPGDSFLAQMNAGLGTAGYVLLLVSTAAHASRWVSREWLAALANEDTVLIPVLLDDSGLPPLLKDIVYVDARRDRAVAILEIGQFFEKERGLAQTKERMLRDLVRGAGGRSRDPPLIPLTRRQLRMVAAHCLDRQGLEAFCFDAEINPNDLRGESVNEKLVDLLHNVSRDGLLDDFSRWLEFERSRCVQHQVGTLSRTPGWAWGDRR